MTRVLRRTVPLLLLATLVLSSDPARSGGRDVPENKSTGESDNSTSWPGLPVGCAPETELIWISGVPYVVSLRPDGSAQIAPSLLGVWDRLVDAARSFGFGEADDGSCG